MSAALRERLLLSGILLVTLALYAPVLSYDFTNWDDPAYVAANPDVRNPSLPSLVRIFDPRTRVVSEWTPIVTSTHQIEHAVLGGGPRVAHAGNLLLHGVCIVLVWVLLRSAGADLLIVVPGTLLFALHPLQAESVAWISGRKTLLATAFGLGSLLLALRGVPRPGRLAASFGLFLLALGSKATAVVVPLWIGAGALAEGSRSVRLRTVAPWVGAMLVVAVARGLGTLTMQADALRRAAELGLGARLEIMGGVLLSYARQLVWPTDLCAHYAWAPPGIASLGGWILVGAGVLIAGLLARRDTRLGLFVAIAALAFLPVSNVLPAPYFQADRYLYAPLAGLAYVLPALLLRVPRIPRRVAAAGFCVWILAWTPITRAQIEVWADARSLWADTLECSPRFVAGWNNLGLVEATSGRPEGAARAFEHALELDPGHLPAYANLGELLLREGRSEEAERILRTGMARGENADVLNNLAWLLLRSDPSEAGHLAERAVALRPRHAAAWDTLGVARRYIGDLEGSRDALLRGLAIRPDLAELHYHLAETWILLGEEEAARRHARRAAALLGGPDPEWVPEVRRLVP